MNTTIEFLDAVKVRHSLSSDYKLAKYLGVTQSSISSYRIKRTFLDDSMALRVANALEIEPMYVIACAHAERTSTHELKEVWRRMADKFISHSRDLRALRDTMQEDAESRDVPLCKIACAPLLTAYF